MCSIPFYYKVKLFYPITAVSNRRRVIILIIYCAAQECNLHSKVDKRLCF